MNSAVCQGLCGEFLLIMKGEGVEPECLLLLITLWHATQSQTGGVKHEQTLRAGPVVSTHEFACSEC